MGPYISHLLHFSFLNVLKKHVQNFQNSCGGPMQNFKITLRDRILCLKIDLFDRRRTLRIACTIPSKVLIGSSSSELSKICIWNRQPQVSFSSSCFHVTLQFTYGVGQLILGKIIQL